MARARERSGLREAVAIGGGLVFAVSLTYFAERYWRGFDAPAPGGSHTRSPGSLDPGFLPLPALWNVLLFTVFALHHSVFARTGLKARVARATAPEMERSAYVWLASVLFIAVCAAWQPVPGLLWELDGWPAAALRATQAGGAVLTLIAARHLDVLELAGIRQALHFPSRRSGGLDDHGPYGLVRHPIYFAWLLLVWPAPVMNGTRFVFALTSTLYLLIAIPFEERDLRRTFGAAYDAYAGRVKRKLIPGVY